jgi:hypothetical protein
MALIPIFPKLQTGDPVLQRLQDNIAISLNPLVTSPTLNTQVLKSVSLSSGTNVINHKLGRNLQGWKITRMRDTFSQIYDSQDSNPNPTKTLILNSSVNVVIDIEVF